jgi:plasmid stabilization system protein ParE
VSRIRWTKQAVDDLESIHEFIARDSSVDADHTIEKLLAAAEQLIDFPNSERRIPERPRSDLREQIQPPFRIGLSPAR